jgi:hypothetical protein
MSPVRGIDIVGSDNKSKRRAKAAGWVNVIKHGTSMGELIYWIYS